MIIPHEFAGRSVAVFGLGASGVSAARALAAAGAHVHAWDDSENARAQAEAAGVPLEDLNKRDWAGLDSLVIAPGVPATGPNAHRMANLARLTGLEIIGDIELFARALGAAPAHMRPRIVGVTGTNGKSTTTALIGHILRQAGLDAHVGGNIGKPALDLPEYHAGAIYVLELSSFQLELTSSLKPNIGVLLNIAPDHLDRHGSMEAYAGAKRRLFARQSGDDVAVIGVDDSMSQRISAEMARAGGPRISRISRERTLSNGVYAVGGVIYDALGGSVSDVADLSRARALRGRHNWQNATAAYAACRALGLAPKKIEEGLYSFPGLAHRMEEVAQRGAARFVNDSKATNVEAARQALASYENIFWIAGGRAKGESYAELAPLMARVTKGFLIGEAAETIAAQLRGTAVFEICRNMETAVEKAAEAAAASESPDPVVLLSPACASFDQYKNFEERGDAFRRLAQAAAGRSAAEARP